MRELVDSVWILTCDEFQNKTKKKKSIEGGWNICTTVHEFSLNMFTPVQEAVVSDGLGVWLQVQHLCGWVWGQVM